MKSSSEEMRETVAKQELEENVNVDGEGRFVFRYKLDPVAVTPDVHGALVDYYKKQLQALLDVIELTRGGEPVRVDGFRFLNSDPTVRAIYG